MSYLFGLINRSSEDILVKRLEDFRDSERPIVFEEDLNYEDGHSFFSSNISFSYLFKKISVSQVI